MKKIILAALAATTLTMALDASTISEHCQEVRKISLAMMSDRQLGINKESIVTGLEVIKIKEVKQFYTSVLDQAYMYPVYDTKAYRDTYIIYFADRQFFGCLIDTGLNTLPYGG